MTKREVDTPADDYSKFKDGPGDNLIAALTGLAVEQQQAEIKVLKLEEDLATAKKELRDLSEHKVPDLMDEVGLGDFTTKEGIHIEIDEIIRASIAKQDQKRQISAFKWLEDNGHANLIKRQFKIQFGKDDEKWANKFERDLAQRKKPLAVKRTKEVHAQTLVASVRTWLEEGVSFPQTTFGVMRQRFSKISHK